jgi:hypothetical protein
MMWAVCALDELFQDEEGKFEEGFGKCYIHDHYTEVLDNYKNPLSKPTPLTYAMVVVRERTKNGVKDKTEKWTGPDGKEYTVPMIRVIRDYWKRFFSSVHAAAFEDASVCTKDYAITKKDKGYEIVNTSITPNHHPAITDNSVLGTADATDSWKLYDQVLELTGYDLRRCFASRPTRSGSTPGSSRARGTRRRTTTPRPTTPAPRPVPARAQP